MRIFDTTVEVMEGVQRQYTAVELGPDDELTPDGLEYRANCENIDHFGTTYPKDALP
jgi:hypothetical protein